MREKDLQNGWIYMPYKIWCTEVGTIQINWLNRKSWESCSHGALTANPNIKGYKRPAWQLRQSKYICNMAFYCQMALKTLRALKVLAPKTFLLIISAAYFEHHSKKLNVKTFSNSHTNRKNQKFLPMNSLSGVTITWCHTQYFVLAPIY